MDPFDEVGLETVTAHVMVNNAASERSLEKAGFRLAEPGLLEDWGKEELVEVDKFVYEASFENR